MRVVATFAPDSAVFFRATVIHGAGSTDLGFLQAPCWMMLDMGLLERTGIACVLTYFVGVGILRCLSL